MRRKERRKVRVRGREKNLEVATADEEVDLEVLHSFQVLQSGVDVVEVAMGASLHCDPHFSFAFLSLHSLQSTERVEQQTAAIQTHTKLKTLNTQRYISSTYRQRKKYTEIHII